MDDRPCLTDNAQQLLQSRYLRKDNDGNIIETPRQLFERVAKCVAYPELAYGGASAYDGFYRVILDAMLDLTLMPASPYLFNARDPRQERPGGLFSCFPAGTPILTPTGNKNIEDIEVCDSVITHKGNVRKVISLNHRDIHEEIVKLSVCGIYSGLGTIKVTKEHPILAIKKDNLTCIRDKNLRCSVGCKRCQGDNKNYRTVCEYVDKDKCIPQWINAGDLQEGDYVVVQHDNSVIDFDTIDIKRVASGLGVIEKNGILFCDNKNNRGNGVNRFVDVDNEFMLFIGYWLAEGCVNQNNTVQFTFHINEKDYIDDVVRIGRCKFGIEPHFEYPDGQKCVQIKFHSKILAFWFSNVFGKCAVSKRMPRPFLQLPQSKQRWLLCGLLRGDGTILTADSKQNVVSLALVNYELTNQVYGLLLRQGYCCNIRRDNKCELSIDFPHRITASACDMAELSNMVLGRNVFKRSNYSYKTLIFDDYVLYKVSKTERIKYNGYVYNFEVEEDNSYIANWIAVHDCFVLPLNDSIDGIYKCIGECAKIYQAAGGIGVDFSVLRERKAIVETSKGVASGPLSFLNIFHHSACEMTHGGVRRAASIAFMDMDHPDIEDFIAIKSRNLPEINRLMRIILTSSDRTLKRFAKLQIERLQHLTSFNLSVKMTNAFMKAVEENADWNLVSRKTGKVTKTLKARKLFNMVCEYAWKSGDPGLVFIDTVNKSNSLPGLGPLKASNPCQSADSVILTENGYMRVADLIGRNDIKLIYNQKKYSHTGFYKTAESAQLIEITLNTGQCFKVTPNHNLLLENGNKIRADSLHVGDKLERHIYNIHDDSINECEYEKGILVGWYIADGSKDGKSVGYRLCVGKNELDCCNYLLKIIKRHCGGKARFINDKNETCKRIYIRQNFRDIIACECKKDFKLLRRSKSFKLGFLRAIFTADGDISKKVIRLSFVNNYKIYREIQLVLQEFGIRSTIGVRQRAKKYIANDGEIRNNKDCYALYIGRTNDFKIVGFLNKFKQERLDKLCKRHIMDYKPIYVKQLKSCDNEPVYNTTVEKIHKYVVHGVGSANCGEQFLHPYHACNLVAISISKCVQDGGLDIGKLRHYAHIATRMAENAIDVSSYALPQIEQSVKATRGVGIGIMGLADALIKLRIPYDSENARRFAQDAFKHIKEAAIEQSKLLYKERGLPDNWKHSIWAKRNIKIRNLWHTTCQPTGSVSIIAGDSQSIEPLFNVYFKRSTNDGKILVEINKLFKEALESRGISVDDTIAALERTGSIQRIDFIPDDIKALFRCAHDISYEAHILMQGAVQKYVDSGISKCIAKGTLVQTNNGLIPVENIGNATQQGEFSDLQYSDLKVMGHDGEWHSVVSHYCDGKKDTIKIRCNNGAVLEASPIHCVMTPDGWRKMSELYVGDWITTSVSRTNFAIGGQSLPKLVYKNKAYVGRYKNIAVPASMNVELASILGALCADGHFEESIGLISLTEKNDVVGLRYKRLFGKIFGHEPKAVIDKRTGCTSWNFNSIPLCSWIVDLIGYRSHTKHVPLQILMGSKEEQVAFLGGVSLDGYKAKCPKSSLGESTVLYCGRSESLAKDIFAMCVSLGLMPYYGKRLIKSHGYYVYHVKVRGFLDCWEEHKNTNLGASEYFVRTPGSKMLRQYCPKPDSYDTKYQTIKKWIRNGTKVARNTVLRRYNIPYNTETKFVRVVDISHGVAELYDIEVENAHSYTINGIISHNTINMPSTATQSDIAKAYKLAYSLGCKGTTIFREGSKAGVLSVVSAEDKYHEELRRWLYTKFSREGLSAREISDLLGVSEQVIFANLKRFGIRKEEHETARRASQQKLDESLREIILANILVGHSRLTTVDCQSSYRQVTDHIPYAHSVRSKFLDRGIHCGEIMTIVTDKTYYYFDTCFLRDIYELPIDCDSVISVRNKRAIRALLTPYFMRHLFLVGGVKTGKGGIKFTSNSRNAEILSEVMVAFGELTGIELNAYEDSAYIPKHSVDDFYSFLESGADINAEFIVPLTCPECGTEVIINEKCSTCPSCGWGCCAI